MSDAHPQSGDHDQGQRIRLLEARLQMQERVLRDHRRWNIALICVMLAFILLRLLSW